MDSVPPHTAMARMKVIRVPMLFCMSAYFFAPTCWLSRICPPVQKPRHMKVSSSTSRPPTETADSPDAPI